MEHAQLNAYDDAAGSEFTTRDYWKSLLGFAFCLIWPTVSMFKKLPPVLLFVYVGFVFASLLVVTRCLPRAVWRRCADPKIAIPVLGVFFLALSAAFFMIYPAIDTAGFRLFGRQFGACDCDDAINQSIANILAGKYPYYETTFLGGRISPMPGVFLLASPFYFTGCSAFQNIFWLAVFIIGLGRYLRSVTASLLVAIFVLFLSPNVTYQALQGADYLANTAYVLTFSALLFESARRKSRFGWSALWAVMLGIGLSSRANFMFAAVLLYAAMLKNFGLKKSTLLMFFAGVSWCATTLPFLLYDPAHFTPLGSVRKLGNIPPWVASACVAVGLLLTLALAMRYKKKAPTLVCFCRDVFWVQVYFVAIRTLNVSIARNTFFIDETYFGMFFSLFGFAAFTPGLLSHIAATTKRL